MFLKTRAGMPFKGGHLSPTVRYFLVLVHFSTSWKTLLTLESAVNSVDLYASIQKSKGRRYRTLETFTNMSFLGTSPNLLFYLREQSMKS